jgi:AraC-like DNA-binding protein
MSRVSTQNMSTIQAQANSPSFTAEGLYIRFGAILGPFVEEVGINRQALTDPNVLVPLDKHCRILELAARRTDDDYVGLNIGCQVHPRDMGPLGYTILNSPDVNAALQSFVRYLRVYARGCKFDLVVDGESAYFNYSYTFTEPCAIERRQEAECTLAMVKRTLEVITSKKLELEAVGFEHPKPEHSVKHEQVFAAPLYFSQQVNFLKFKSSLLQREAAHAEHRLFEVLEKHLAEVITTQVEEDDLVTKVGNTIAQSLSNGVPSIDEVAATLFMTKRTLQRRLAAEGVLYNEFADGIRRKLAIQYVENTKMPLTEVAFLLGYSHISAFSRAFRRWMGKSPIDYRGGDACNH